MLKPAMQVAAVVLEGVSSLQVHVSNQNVMYMPIIAALNGFAALGLHANLQHSTDT